MSKGFQIALIVTAIIMVILSYGLVSLTVTMLQARIPMTLQTPEQFLAERYEYKVVVFNLLSDKSDLTFAKKIKLEAGDILLENAARIDDDQRVVLRPKHFIPLSFRRVSIEINEEWLGATR